MFDPNLVIESHDGSPLDVSLDHIVSGELANAPRSKVYGSVIDGVFEGKIHTDHNDETFYVERAKRYFDKPDVGHHNQTSLPFHSIIYSSNAVTDAHRHKRAKIGAGCGLADGMN